MQTYNRAHSEGAIKNKASSLKSQGLTQPAVIDRMWKEGFPVWEDWALRYVAMGLGEPRLNATNWVADARALGWVPQAPTVSNGNGRDGLGVANEVDDRETNDNGNADEEVNDQIGREADDGEKRDTQASEMIPMNEKKTLGLGPEGKVEQDFREQNNHSTDHNDVKEKTSALKKDGAGHHGPDVDDAPNLAEKDDHEFDGTNHDGPDHVVDDALAPAQSFEVTRFRSAEGRITKRVELDEQGKLSIDGAPTLWRGTAWRERFSSLVEFAEALTRCPSNEAFALGQLVDGLEDQVTIVTIDKLNGGATAQRISRSAEFFHFRPGSGLVAIDSDAKAMPADVRGRVEAAGGVWGALVQALPELKGVRHVLRASTTAGLSAAGEPIVGGSGEHIYVLVDEITDTKRFLTAAHERCWLAGFGWYLISASGDLLARSIVDASVGQPERLLYEGKPVLGRGLAQDAEVRRARVVEGDVLDTAAVLTLTAAEQAELATLQARERPRYATAALAAFEAWLAERGDTVANRLAASTRQLVPDFALQFNNRTLGETTVGDVLANLDKYLGKYLADPLEGVGYGKTKAIVLRWSNGVPYIRSFAHGKVILYSLTDKPDGEPADIGIVEAALATFGEDADWHRVALATHAATGGSDEGWEALNRAHAIEREAWDALQPIAVTVGTLFHLATVAQPGWRGAYDTAIEAMLSDASEAHEQIREAMFGADTGPTQETADTEHAEEEARSSDGSSQETKDSPQSSASPNGDGSTNNGADELDRGGARTENGGARSSASDCDERERANGRDSRAEDKTQSAGEAQRGGKAKSSSGDKIHDAIDSAVNVEGSKKKAKGRDKHRDSHVADLNKTYALVLVGDKAAVMKTSADGGIKLLTLSAFEQWHGNKFVQYKTESGAKRVPLAKYWLRHSQRRQYEGIVFAPKRDVVGHYNLWKGFAVEARQGDCSKFLAHLKDNVCRGDEELYKWVIAWFAQIVQYPEKKVGTSLVLRGKMGVGKTKVGEVIGSLLGEHYALVSDPRYVTGRFNSHQVSCLLLHCDESFWAGDHAAEGKLKDLITGEHQFIEYKGKEPIRVRNYVRLLVTGNPDWLVPAAFEERRFAVLDVGEAKMQDNKYFAAIDAEMDSGGREALLDHLLRFDLKTVNLHEIPKTAALLDQKIASLPAEKGWWLDVLMHGQLPWGCDEGTNSCPASRLFDQYVKHAGRRGVKRRAIETQLGIFLSHYVPELRRSKSSFTRWTQAKGVHKVEGYIYTFPTLAQCREAFVEKIQQQITWDESEYWAIEPPPEGDPPF